MKKTASSVDSTERSRVSWGKFFRTKHLQPEHPSVQAPELEYVIINRAPLPTPAVLMDYDHALPGTADRIVRLLEQQVAAEIARANKSYSFTSLTRLVAVIGGFILLWYGKNSTAAIAFVAFILTFADFGGPFIGRKVRQPKTQQKNFEQVMNAMALEVSPVDYPSKPDNEKANLDART